MQAGADALGALTAQRKMDLGVVAQRRDVDGPMVDRALAIVRRFILERGLILFGGLAIDYALRLRGGRLYPDDERPDFDVLSPRAVGDAYDLADALAAAGFANVGAIRALHVQTMKVRTSFVPVADIGYAPPDVFDRIPTLEYQGMRVVHPDFQRMDQHLAFCFPLANPPREDVFHRWRKDLARFNLFEAAYPVAAAPAPAAAAGAPKTLTARLAVPVRGRGPDLTVALHGFAAYAVLRAGLDELAAALGAEAAHVEERVSAPALRLAFPDDRSFAVEAPAGDSAHVAGPDPAGALGAGAGAQWSDPYMDLNPESARRGDVTVLSTRGRLLAVSLVSLAGAGPQAAAPGLGGGKRAPPQEPPGGRAQALVVTPQYLLLHFLFESHRAAGPDREVYRAYYCHTLEILRAAEALVASRLEALGDDQAAAREALLDAFAESPFAPSVRTLGTVNNSAAYVIKMAANAERLRDTPPPELGLDPDLAAVLDGLPQNYYPKPGRADAARPPRPEFDYSRSALFRRSGLPRAGVPG